MATATATHVKKGNAAHQQLTNAHGPNPPQQTMAFVHAVLCAKYDWCYLDDDGGRISSSFFFFPFAFALLVFIGSRIAVVLHIAYYAFVLLN